MVDQSHENNSDSRDAQQLTTPTPGGSRRWFWRPVTFLILLIPGALFLAWAWGLFPATRQPPLTGELIVVIRPADSGDFLPIEGPGAVPVRSGAAMGLRVNFNQPMYTYLLWLDSQGQVVPLYPWNNERIEVADADQPPPVRIPSKVVLSLGEGAGWTFGPRGGLETVVLLARRAPLGEDTHLGSLLGSLPPAQMRLRDEVAILGLDRGSNAASILLTLNRGTEEEARAVDQPLLARLDKLRDQFELIRVVRFAHEGE